MNNQSPFSTKKYQGIDPAFSDWTKDGMTLRDYFAAKAMQGLCASPAGMEWANSRLAAEAYDLADAMLKARKA